jgi:hypothetical protein
MVAVAGPNVRQPPANPGAPQFVPEGVTLKLSSRVKLTVTPPNVRVHGSNPLKFPEVTVLLTFTTFALKERIAKALLLKRTFGVRVTLPLVEPGLKESTAIGPMVTALHVTE